MPKPVKKAAKKAAKKPRKPSSDPSVRGRQMFEDMEAKQATGATWWDKDGPKAVRHDDFKSVEPVDFETAYRARMSDLGRKGGRVSGANRMKNLTDEKRREIAQKAAEARWKKESEKSKK